MKALSRLAGIRMGTSEVMFMIVTHEWYRERKKKALALGLTRDFEADAEEAFSEEEKIYE
jgi:hypothetical protein